MKKRNVLALLGAGSVVSLVLLAAAPAYATTKTWNYSASGCTQTTITAVATLSGSTLSGYTNRTQDICTPGTHNLTKTLVGESPSGPTNVSSSYGLSSGTAIIGGVPAGRWCDTNHWYASSLRIIEFNG